MERISASAKSCGRKMHYGIIVAMCCCLIMGVNIGLVFSCAGIFYKPVSQSIGVAVGTFGLYMSIMYVASTLILPIAGRMIERWSARWLLSGNSALMGLTLIAMGFMDQVWEFYIAGAVLGLTVAFLLYLSFPTLINRWFRTNVGLLMGICSAASGVGGMVFNPIGAWLITDFGWHVAYWCFGALILAGVTPVLALLLRDYPSDMGLEPFANGKVAAKGKVAEMEVKYSQALRMPIFYGVVLFAFLMMACSTLNLFIPNYVTSLGFNLEQAGYVAAAVMAGVTIGKLLLGHINDRNCLMGVLATTISGALGLFLLIEGEWGLALIVVGAFLFGWAYAGVTVQTTMLTRTVFGSIDYARIYSVVSMALAAGGAVASGGWGLLVDGTSFHFIFWIGVGMLALCALLGLWALSSAFGRK